MIDRRSYRLRPVGGASNSSCHADHLRDDGDEATTPDTPGSGVTMSLDSGSHISGCVQRKSAQAVCHAHGEHEHLPEAVEAAAAEDLPPGQRVLDIPQRAWRQQAEEQWRHAAQTVQIVNRGAATD